MSVRIQVSTARWNAVIRTLIDSLYEKSAPNHIRNRPIQKETIRERDMFYSVLRGRESNIRRLRTFLSINDVE